MEKLEIDKIKQYYLINMKNKKCNLSELVSNNNDIRNADIKVADRIKTFDDAYNKIGSSNPLCLEYDKARLAGIAEDGSDLAAYLKLRIIVAALNEDWDSTFTNGEYRYFPWFYLYTKKEWEELSEEQKCRVVGRSRYSANAHGGLVFADSYFAPAHASSSYGRLAFKSHELAEYAGIQFIDIYADYIVGDRK